MDFPLFIVSCFIGINMPITSISAGTLFRHGSDTSSHQASLLHKGSDTSSHQVSLLHQRSDTSSLQDNDTLLRQGIEGVVYRKGGNLMPAPNRRPGVPGAVVSTICIYELTNDTQTLRQGTTPYYREIHTRLICQINTDSAGKFQVSLPPGTYSVFTKKGDLFYASQRDEKNNIAPVTVLPGKVSRVLCSVESDHRPVY